jgi:hypothetical protein
MSKLGDRQRRDIGLPDVGIGPRKKQDPRPIAITLRPKPSVFIAAHQSHTETTSDPT